MQSLHVIYYGPMADFVLNHFITNSEINLYCMALLFIAGDGARSTGVNDNAQVYSLNQKAQYYFC